MGVDEAVDDYNVVKSKLGADADTSGSRFNDAFRIARAENQRWVMEREWLEQQQLLSNITPWNDRQLQVVMKRIEISRATPFVEQEGVRASKAVLPPFLQDRQEPSRVQGSLPENTKPRSTWIWIQNALMMRTLEKEQCTPGGQTPNKLFEEKLGGFCWR